MWQHRTGRGNIKFNLIITQEGGIVKMDNVFYLIVLVKVIIKVLSIPNCWFSLSMIKGRQYFTYFATPKDAPIKYIAQSWDRCWSQLRDLNVENLTYLLNALNAQEDKKQI